MWLLLLAFATAAAAPNGTCPPQFTCNSTQPFSWNTAAPNSNPLSPSPLRLTFTGKSCTPTNSTWSGACAIKADTWYPSQGADGLFFSSFTDGVVHNVGSGSGNTVNATTGWAVLSGSPADGTLGVVPGRVGTVMRPTPPLAGRYPCGIASFRGTFYTGTYSVDDGQHVPGKNSDFCGGNAWCIAGPFIGFQFSSDGGVTWAGGEHMNASSNANLFKQQWPAPPSPFVFKLLQPHFVDFGRDNQFSPDSYHYLVSHGCTPEDELGLCSWVQGSDIYLLRIQFLTPQTVNDPDAYEFYGGEGVGWVKTLSAARPIVHWPRHTGVTNVVWNPSLQRFVMWVSHANATTGSGTGALSSWVAEAEELTGPWRLVAYLGDFGNQGYFLNSPSAWMTPSPGGSGVTGWLWYSAMWRHTEGVVKPSPPFCNAAPNGTGTGSCYGSVLAEFEMQ